MFEPQEGTKSKNASYYRVRAGLGAAVTTVLAAGTVTATYFMLKETDKNKQAGGLYNNETCPGAPLNVSTSIPYPQFYDCQPNFANTTNTTIEDSWYYDNSFNQTCTDLNNVICATASLAKPLFWGAVGGAGAVFVAAAGTVTCALSKPSSQNDEETTTLLGNKKSSFFDRCCPTFWNKRDNNVKKLSPNKGTELHSSTGDVGVVTEVKPKH